MPKAMVMLSAGQFTVLYSPYTVVERATSGMTIDHLIRDLFGVRWTWADGNVVEGDKAEWLSRFFANRYLRRDFNNPVHYAM